MDGITIIISNLIKEIGFPIFTACYLLFRHDKMLNKILMEVKKINGKKSVRT